MFDEKTYRKYLAFGYFILLVNIICSYISFKYGGNLMFSALALAISILNVMRLTKK